MTDEALAPAIENEVPPALRNWFVVHFWADILFALPMFIAPIYCLELIGWIHVDPYTARLTAAALFGIGIESYLGRNASAESFRTMLTLKVIWSATAVIGIAWTLIEGPQGRPLMAYGFLATFVAFHILWQYWLRRMKAQKQS